MSGTLRFVGRVMRMPSSLLLAKIMRRLRVSRVRARARLRPMLRGAYASPNDGVRVERIVQLPPEAELAARAGQLRSSVRYFVENRFDLLGLGWRDLSGSRGRSVGTAGGRRLQFPLAARRDDRHVQAVLQLIDAGYCPIDWHRDPRSGHRWDAQRWHASIPIPEDGRGTDIKFPWELSRCQHLPQLALYVAGAAAGDPLSAAAVRAFRNQVLDFIAANPPGYGVNWRCAMDVGIRAANWLIAFDLFRAAGIAFDAAFERMFAASVLDHAQYVSENLEWTEHGRSNHYLADIVSLVVIGAYMHRTPRIAALAHWSVGEFLAEVHEQFDDDGANREASTCYHRLCAELAIHGAAFACRLAASSGLRLARVPPFRPAHSRSSSSRRCSGALERLAAEGLPDAVRSRLHGMGRFVVEASRGDGTMPQIGDNDSGRLFRISSVIAECTVAEARARYLNLDDYGELPDPAVFPIESMLDHRHIPMALLAFFPDEQRFRFAGADPVEVRLVASIAGPAAVAPVPECAWRRTRTGAAGELAQFRAAFDRADPACRQAYVFALPQRCDPERTSVQAFVDFGLFVLRGDGFHLTLRCGPPARHGSGSHLHHDQLSLDIVVGGQHAVADPGTFVYTADPAERRRYRAARAHFAPWPAQPPAGAADEPLFALPGFSAARCVYCREDGLVGQHGAQGSEVTRIVTVEADHVAVLDYSAGIVLERCPCAGEPSRFVGLPVSDRYGGRLR
jgi:hypothetical protein